MSINTYVDLELRLDLVLLLDHYGVVVALQGDPTELQACTEAKASATVLLQEVLIGICGPIGSENCINMHEGLYVEHAQQGRVNLRRLPVEGEVPIKAQVFSSDTSLACSIVVVANILHSFEILQIEGIIHLEGTGLTSQVLDITT